MAAPLDAAAAFSKYERAGHVNVEGLRALLKDLGLLEGRLPSDANVFVAQQFAMADRRTKDDKLDEAEFTKYYEKVTAPKLLDALSAELPGEVEQLHGVFAAFASFGAMRGAPPAAELDGPRFVKLAKETGLVGRGLTTTDCDLMFAKAKERSSRRINFEQFLDVLDMIAAKKKRPLQDIVRQVAGAQGPALSGTTAAEAVRFHDDLSTYTGTHVHRRSSLASQGTPAGGSSVPPLKRRSSMGTPGSAGGSQLSARRASFREGGTPDVQSRDALREAFVAFASFGKGVSPLPGKGGVEMDGKQFVKCMRDAGIIDRKLTATSCDLAFVAKAKPLGARKISFRQFKEAVAQLAAEKEVAKEELYAQIAGCAGPSLNCSVTPEAVCPESGRLLSRTGSGDTPADHADHVAAAAATWSAAAAEAEAEAAQAEGGLAAGMDKMSLSGGNVVHISASAAATASPCDA